MTGQELVRGDSFGGRYAVLGVTVGEKYIRQGNEQDVVMDGAALSDDGALEEGCQKGV